MYLNFRYGVKNYLIPDLSVRESNEVFPQRSMAVAYYPWNMRRKVLLTSSGAPITPLDDELEQESDEAITRAKSGKAITEVSSCSDVWFQNSILGEPPCWTLSSLGP
jgi:hypothetical protein